jgi:hypothetical protein
MKLILSNTLMKKEDKQLLLVDLCARLPYEVKVQYNNEIYNVDYISVLYEEVKLDIPDNYTVGISEIKPYLRPMSSMTEKERKQLLIYVLGDGDVIKYFEVKDDGSIDNTDAAHQNLNNFNIHWVNFDGDTTSRYIDWLNAHHFDYRGLIEKGLAIEVTKENNPYKD